MEDYTAEMIKDITINVKPSLIGTISWLFSAS